MHDQPLIESIFEERIFGSISLHPAAKINASSEIFSLRPVASGVREDEVVGEVDRIPHAR